MSDVEHEITVDLHPGRHGDHAKYQHRASCTCTWTTEHMAVMTHDEALGYAQRHLARHGATPAPSHHG